MMFGTQGPSVVEGVKPLRGNGTFWDYITVLDVRKRAVGGELTLLDGLNNQSVLALALGIYLNREDMSLNSSGNIQVLQVKA